jgi:MFS family permease
MAVMMAGSIVGMLVLSLIKIKPGWRSWLFCCSQLAVGTLIVPLGFLLNVAWFFPVVFAIGLFNAVIGIMLNTVLQSSVPPENRGKVFGTLGTLSSALQPIGMASSGIIAQQFGVRPTFIVCCCAVLALSFPIIFSRHFRKFMNSEQPEESAVQAAAADACAE